MRITLTGTNSYFLADAFFDNAGTLDSIDVTSPREVVSTEVVVENSQTGMVTTFTGTNLLINAEGNPVQGTLTGASFSQGGQVQATVSGISWDFPTFLDALLSIQDSGDHAPLAALINSAGPVVLDGSGALAGAEFQDSWNAYRPFITQPFDVTGSGFSDAIQGGNGNDTLDPGFNTYGEDDIEGTPGNDVIRFTNATPQSFFWLDYENIDGALSIAVDGDADLGSIAGPGFTDALVDVQKALRADGLGIEGSEFDDTFTVAPGADGWLNLRGNEGDDTYNITLDGTVRLSFNFGADAAPTAGLQMDLQTGIVANDGFGGTDRVNLTAGSGRLEIRGTDNNDSVLGSDGDEGFIAERGNDTFDGAGGTDYIRYDRSDVGAVDVDLGAGSATVIWDGNTYTHVLRNVEVVRGSRDDNDTIAGGAANETLAGYGGDDLLSGNGGDDELFGEAGNDTLRGGAGDDMLDSYTGNDVLSGGDGNDVLDAYDGDDSLDGGAGDDELRGEDGNDTLLGDAGEDTLSGGAGTDSLDGGAGNDLAYAGAGNDTLEGGEGLDTLYGAGDDDVLTGGPGNDLLGGGGGNDSLDGGSDDDEIWTALGDDTAFGGPGNDSLGGAAGHDSLHGGTGDDELWGAAGNDTSQGGPGNDTLGGADGDDRLDGGSDDDEVWGAAGDDWLDGSDGNDQLGGGIGDDTQYGGDGQDTVSGGLGNDLLGGDGGDDLIFGAAGNDWIEGGAGADTIYGGPGSDILNYGVGGGMDEINGFSIADDTLELDDALWTGTLTEWQVVNQFGSVQGADLLLDFGNGDMITLTGQAGQTDLYTAIDIF